MDEFLLSLPIVATLLIGAISPGPSFVVVAKTSLAGSALKGVSVAFGIALASALFGIGALAGLQFIFENVPWLYLTLRIGGGIYLLYLAFKIFRGAKKPLVKIGNRTGSDVQKDLVKGVLLGLVTQMSNPKTAVVFASVFATFISGEVSLSLFFILIPLIFITELLWYTLVAMALSKPKPQKLYSQAKISLDRLAALILGALGIKLISDSL